MQHRVTASTRRALLCSLVLSTSCITFWTRLGFSHCSYSFLLLLKVLTSPQDEAGHHCHGTCSRRSALPAPLGWSGGVSLGVSHAEPCSATCLSTSKRMRVEPGSSFIACTSKIRWIPKKHFTLQVRVMLLPHEWLTWNRRAGVTSCSGTSAKATPRSDSSPSWVVPREEPHS